MKNIEEEQLKWSKFAVASALVIGAIQIAISIAQVGGFAWATIAGTFVLGIVVGFFARGIWQNRSAASKPDTLGLSKAASDKRDQMTDSELDAFEKVCGTAIYDGGEPSSPLIFDMDDAHLKLIGLSSSDVEALIDRGVIKKRANLKPLRDLSWADELDMPEEEYATGVEAYEDKVRYWFKDGPKEFPRNRQYVAKPGYIGGYHVVVDLGMIDFTPDGREIAGKIATPTAGSIEVYVSRCLADNAAKPDSY